MASPSDDILLLLFKTVARLEIKVNDLIERDKKRAKSDRTYLRGVIKALRNERGELKIYVKKLEKELNL